MMQPFVDLEVTGVVDGGLGAQGPPFFVVLLDLGVLVVHVQRRKDSFGQHPRAKASGRTLAYAPFENQLHLIGSAQVEVLVDALNALVFAEVDGENSLGGRAHGAICVGAKVHADRNTLRLPHPSGSEICRDLSCGVWLWLSAAELWCCSFTAWQQKVAANVETSRPRLLDLLDTGAS
jgi:hypothetical protein